MSNGEPIATQNSAYHFKLTRDLIWLHNGETMTVPKGFQSDGASIPKLFRFLFRKDLNNPSSSLNIASYLHDFAFFNNHQVILNGSLVTISRRQNDLLFLRALLDFQYNKILSILLFIIVHSFSWIWWTIK
jgi:hypothetical protein